MLVFLIGTKAQYIKMAPVIIETMRQELDYRLVYTGQHSETFDDLQNNFGLPPADAVLVDQAEATDRQNFLKWLWRSWRAAQSSRMREVWIGAKALIVHGDTASTLLGARIARRYNRPLVHVEAGLRSFNFFHPFPEELIRVLVSRWASLHCAPDDIAAANLRKAGVGGEILVTGGNTMMDALRLAAESKGMPPEETGEPYGIFSLHRHENLFDRARLDAALDILRSLSGLTKMLFVLHPVTQKRLESLGLLEQLKSHDRIRLVPRMNFFSFNRLLRGARFVATDGGSNQEECALLAIPCILLRRATERADGLGQGVILGDLDVPGILAFAQQACANSTHIRLLPEASPSRMIVDRLSKLD